jgi:FtsH-binding integral membrane protein
MTQATGTAVPGSTESGAAARGPDHPDVTLNDDGQRHPMENLLSLFTLVAGIVACVLGFLANQSGMGAWAHVGATWLGLITLIVGLPAQLFSSTRAERMLIVTGLVAAFVGVCLGLAHGGLLP